MTAFDYAVIAIIVLSVLLGWWRGLVYEVVSLLGWVAAWLVARWFAASLAAHLPASMGAEAVRMMAAFVLLFVATLIVSAIVAWLLSKLIKLANLGGLDGFFGALFGALRGGLVVLILVLLAGMTGATKESFWREASLSKPLESLAQVGLTWLPDSVAQRVRSGLNTEIGK